MGLMSVDKTVDDEVFEPGDYLVDNSGVEGGDPVSSLSEGGVDETVDNLVEPPVDEGGDIEEVLARLRGDDVGVREPLPGRVDLSVVVERGLSVAEGSSFTGDLEWEFMIDDEVPYLVFREGGVVVVGVALTKRVVESLGSGLDDVRRLYEPVVKKDKLWVRFKKWYARMRREHGIVTALGSLMIGGIAVVMVGLSVYTMVTQSQLWLWLMG